MWKRWLMGVELRLMTKYRPVVALAITLVVHSVVPWASRGSSEALNKVEKVEVRNGVPRGWSLAAD